MSSIEEYKNKIEMYYHLLAAWVQLKQEGKNFADFFINRGYKRIAIYGIKEMGELMISEIEQSPLELICMIDKNVHANNTSYPIIVPNGKLPDLDAVVVTACYYYDEIKLELSQRTDADIISLKEVIYELQ